MSLGNARVILGACLVLQTASALADHPTIAFGSEGAGAINTIAATPLPAGSWGIGLRSEIIDNDAFTTEQLEDFAASGNEGVHSIDSITSTSVSLSYGVSEDLSISARLPFITRKNIRESELDGVTPEAHTHGDSSGLGDLVLLGQYRVLNDAGRDVAGLLGVKAPTGKTDETDNDGVRFETEFQPGSGSWDMLAGASISVSNGNLGYHANVLYNLTTEGSQATKIGDALSYNLALTYRIGENHADHDHVHEGGTGLQWDLSLELNGETRDETEIAGVIEPNSGGTTVYVSPGIRISANGFSAFLSYGIPVVQDQNGIQTDVDSRIVLGLSLAL